MGIMSDLILDLREIRNHEVNSGHNDADIILHNLLYIMLSPT